MSARALQAIMGGVWAIQPETLDGLIAVADREGEFEALQTRVGQPIAAAERATVRDGVAVVPVTGPLFRYANLMTAFCGATSYATIASDLQAAVDDPAVKAIVLTFDSPGGATNGVNETAKLIRDARQRKPVVAYVGGMAASAGYWLAAAAGEIIADEAAILGSIGAMITVEEQAGDRQGRKTYKFTSSVSPNKNASPSTDAGRAEIQRLADELGALFVESVAADRGVSTDVILQNYGQGAVYTGAEAMKRGMIDGTGTLEGVIARFATEQNADEYMRRLQTTGATTMADPKTHAKLTAADLKAQHPEAAGELIAEGAASVDTAKLTADAKAAGAAAERDRLASIEALAMPGTEEIVAKLKADPNATAATAAVEILQAVKAGTVTTAAAPVKDTTGADHLAGLAGTEAALKPPKAGNGTDAEPDASAFLDSMVAAARKAGAIA